MSNEETNRAGEELDVETVNEEDVRAEGGVVAAAGGGHYMHFQNGAFDWSEQLYEGCKLVVEVSIWPSKARYYRTELTRERPTGTPYRPLLQNRSYIVSFYLRNALPDGRCPGGDPWPEATSKLLSVSGGDKMVKLIGGSQGFEVVVSDY
ncbi:MAG TPA: hypothetical protein VER32_08305 [Pyrinomonadaceae bacterium]|nr:hypothetical protein [Pyrinomonadaceae bacterium]